MIIALLILGSWQTLNVLLLLAAARFGVVSLHVRRPPKPRNRPTTPEVTS